MKMHTTRFLVGLAGIAMLTFVACGGDSSPAGPGISLDSPAAVSSSSGSVQALSETAPTPISAEEACPAGLETETVDGVTACVHETDFDVERCVRPFMMEGKTELVLKMGFLNPTNRLLYNKPAFFHSRKATCGAIEENPGRAIEAVTGFPIEGKSNGIATWTFPLDDSQCGAYAFLDTVRNGDILFAPMHYIINTGKDCPLTCRDLNPQLKATESPFAASTATESPFATSALARKVPVDFTATWNGTGATGVLYKKATMRNEPVRSNVSPINHRYRYLPGPYSNGQTARLEVTKGALTCTASVKVGGRRVVAAAD